MKLSKYLYETGKSQTDFAAECGVDPITVYRWIKGLRVPRAHIQLIMKVTGGTVTANDFVSISPAAPSRAQSADQVPHDQS